VAVRAEAEMVEGKGMAAVETATAAMVVGMATGTGGATAESLVEAARVAD
jgi:hypothetical protein